MKWTTALLLVLAIALPASAATYTWQGGSGWWGDLNWDVDGTPNQANPGTTVTNHDLIINDSGAGLIGRGGQLTWSTGSSLVMTGGRMIVSTVRVNVTGALWLPAASVAMKEKEWGPFASAAGV